MLVCNVSELDGTHNSKQHLLDLKMNRLILLAICAQALSLSSLLHFRICALLDQRKPNVKRIDNIIRGGIDV